MFMGFGLIFTVLIVVGFVYLLNSRGQSLNNLISPSANSGKSPLEIARERYARGEIDKAEYEAIHSDLLQT